MESAKLLIPTARVRRCAGSWQFRQVPPLLERALRDMLALDEEANAVLNVRLTWESRSFGLYAWYCLYLEGDLVRTIPTIFVPMSGGHGHDPVSPSER